ncbi:MAG: hypothetical protein WB689_24165 [Xanthobacteraceae bacterium]
MHTSSTEHLDSDWRISRLTELLLTGHNWKSVRNIMLISKQEFDCTLEAAVTKAKAEQNQRIEHHPSEANLG